MIEMSNLEQLKQFNKLTSDSFHKQKNFIKKVLGGKVTQCPTCQQSLSILMRDGDEMSHIQCQKKCTDIELDCS